MRGITNFVTLWDALDDCVDVFDIGNFPRGYLNELRCDPLAVAAHFDRLAAELEAAQ